MKHPDIKGTRGVWTATFRGLTLPVIHDTRAGGIRDSGREYDHGPISSEGKGKAFREAFDNPDRWVIMQRDELDENGRPTGDRNGYIGVFEFTDLDLTGGGCTLKLMKRVAG